jgi:hypothetical protein
MHQYTAYRSAIWAFGAGSLLAILPGAAAMALADIPLSIWIRNPVAWFAAAAVGIFIASRGWFGVGAIVVAAIVIGLSLVSPGQEGVFRWVGAGPVQLNAAALVLPVAIAAFARARAWIAALSFVIIGAVIAHQPDISQLAGFAIASVILFAFAFGWKGALGSLILGFALVAYCLRQPDPLLPVAHVEGILLLAFSQSQVLGIAMAAGLGLAAVSPILLLRSPDVRWQALALSAYFGATSLAPLFGTYPVPLAGYGLSFVIGWGLGFAALATRRQANSLTSG